MGGAADQQAAGGAAGVARSTHSGRYRRTRRPHMSLDRLSYVLLAAFTVIVLGPALAGRGALVDLDKLTAFMPVRALEGRQTADVIMCRTDTIDYYLPGIAAIKNAFWSGSFPTWAPYEVGGAPLASLPNHAALSPLSLPYFLLPLWLAPAYVKLGELVVGIGGMVLFLRRHGVSRGAAVLAGVAFVSCGFMMMWTNWPHTRVAAFIPALFWVLERLVQERRLGDVALLAVVVASMLLGGFPAVTLYALTLAAVYVLVRVVVEHRRSGSGTVAVLVSAAGGVLLGAGIAAIQLLPFVAYLGQLGLAERRQHGEHLPLGLFLTTVAPDTVGRCVGGERYTSTNPVEAIGFVGAAALVLAVSAVVLRHTARNRAPRVFLAVALAVVVVLIWVGGPLLVLLQQLPFFSSNAISRGQSVFGFLAAALAGVGLDRLARSRSDGAAGPPVRRAWHVALGPVVLALVIGFSATVVVAAFRDADRDGYRSHLVVAVSVPLLLVAAAVVAVAVARFGRRPWREAGLVALAVLVVGQSTAFAHSVLPLSNRDNLYPVTPTHAFLQANIGGERFGAGDEDRVMLTSVSDWYRLRTPVGHEFTQPEWRQLLATADPDVAISRTYSAFSLPRLGVVGRSPVLDQLAVRYWVASPSRIEGRTDGSVEGAQTIPLREGGRASCRIGGGPLRGIRVGIARSHAVPAGGRAALHVTVRSPSGIREGERLLESRLRPGGLAVAVAGEDLRSSGPSTVEVRVTDVSGDVQLRGSGGSLSCAAVRPVPDGLRLVFADAGSAVYRRLDALPRIRWAAHSEVVSGTRARLSRLRAGVPGDTVLLDDPSTAPAGGGAAEVRVVEDDAERIAVRVEGAATNGYLLVADALVRDGWHATVDGEPASVVPGNHAFAAVPVPGGSHTVVLRYTAPGLAAGAWTSAASVLVALGLLVAPPALRRRRRPRTGPRTGYPEGPDLPEPGAKGAR